MLVGLGGALSTLALVVAGVGFAGSGSADVAVDPAVVDAAPRQSASAEDPREASTGTARARAGALAGAQAQDPAQDARPRSEARKEARKERAAERRAQTALPPASGSGRRAVFSESRQRVWIVSEDEEVLRTYPVSGSIYDNLDPGTYEVFSRSAKAWGIDDSGTMEWFVRFTHGDAGAAIGFHSIPEKDGEPVQTEEQLGTPLSHGCIRQREEDALAMWDFAQLGTTVVVTP